MNLNKIKTFWPYLNRMGVIYVLIAAIAFLIVDFDGLINNARSEALSRLIPEYTHFTSDIQEGRALDQHNLRQGVYYYYKVLEYVPNLPDVYPLLAFSHYHLGEIDQALSTWEKGIGKNPTFFWYYYNIGAVYYNQGEYDQAVEYFKKAYESHVVLGVRFIYTSKLYLPIMLQVKDAENIIKENLEFGKKKALAAVYLCQYMANFEKISALSGFILPKKAPLKGFIYYELGKKAYNREDYPLALRFLEQSLGENNANIQNLELILQVLKKLNKKNQAKLIEKRLIQQQKPHNSHHLEAYSIVPELF